MIDPPAKGPMPDGTYRIRLNTRESQRDFNKQMSRVRAAGGVFDPVMHTYRVEATDPRTKVLVDWLIRRHHVEVLG